MARNLDQDLFYCPPGTCHYNVKLKGGGLLNRVTARSLRELPFDQIEWVWVVEEKRRASAEEIKRLCTAG